MRQRRQKKISEIVADKSASRVKPVLEQSAEQRFVARERDHAVAYIAWWQNPVFTAQAAGAAAVIRDGHNRGKIGDRAFRSGRRIVAWNHVMFQSAQQRRKSRPAAQGDDAQAAMLLVFFRA